MKQIFYYWNKKVKNNLIVAILKRSHLIIQTKSLKKSSLAEVTEVPGSPLINNNKCWSEE